MNLDDDGGKVTLVNVPEESARRIGYDSQSRVLEILDAAGDTWRFHGVPPDTAGGLLGSRRPAEVIVADLRTRFRHSKW